MKKIRATLQKVKLRPVLVLLGRALTNRQVAVKLAGFVVTLAATLFGAKLAAAPVTGALVALGLLIAAVENHR